MGDADEPQYDTPRLHRLAATTGNWRRSTLGQARGRLVRSVLPGGR